MKRKDIVMEVGEILDHYCNGCFLKRHNRNTHSRRYAQMFCIKQCTIGEKLKEYGNKLS